MPSTRKEKEKDESDRENGTAKPRERDTVNDAENPSSLGRWRKRSDDADAGGREDAAK